MWSMLILFLCLAASAEETPRRWSVTADLDANGEKETVTVTAGADPCMAVTRGERVLWRGGPGSWHPWKLRLADVEGDGQHEIVLGVHKSSRFIPRPHNSLFVLAWDGEAVGPKWMGSALARPFVDFEFLAGGNKGDWLVAVEITRENRRQLSAYHWDRFGFVGVWRDDERREVALHRRVNGSLRVGADGESYQFLRLREKFVLRPVTASVEATAPSTTER